MSNDQVTEIKNHMGILVDGLRDEIRIVADGILGNTQSIGRLEVKVDHLEQEVQQVKYDLADTEQRLIQKIETVNNNLSTKINKLEKSTTRKITHLEKEVFG